jgi:hypothetical protein
MGEISSRQIYDLLLEISHGMTQLGASIGELLIDMRTLNRDMLVPARHFSGPSQNPSGIFCR